jgi:hypothetical protein
MHFQLRECDNNYTRIKVSPNKFGIHLTTIEGTILELETVMKNSLFKVFQSVNRRFGLFFGMKEYGKE